MPDPQTATYRPYRFGFVMSTALGNLTRYQNFHKYAVRDPSVECVWAPVKHYLAPDEPDPYARWPRFLRTRAIVLRQAAPVLRRPSSFDALLIHLYEADILLGLRSYLRTRPLRIVSTDDAPVLDPSTYPIHPVDARKPRWKQALRLRIDLWRARRSDAQIPLSRWAADILVEGAGLPRDRVVPIHVGLDLESWPYRQHTSHDPARRLKLLFVGGDFERKGGALLLQVFRERFADTAELHLVTQGAPAVLPAHVQVHKDLTPNDPRLAALYRDCDVFVLPTTADLSSWVALEAMASGCPVIATPVAGIVDIVIDRQTGLLVPVGDAAALATAIATLLDDAGLRARLGASGRRHVEAHFDAACNVPRILQLMKDRVDASRRASGRRGR
jgi:glycosyltransferase involved in cell wall biosynthesis